MAHDHDGDERNHRTAPSNEPRVAALGDLHDYEVAEGYPDVRGWAVKLADGRTAGKVHELIVDTGTMQTRYLDVRLDRDLAGAAGERDVLIPVGTARLDGRGDNVLVDNLSADQLASMPAYEHGSLTRDHEMAVRRHFDASATMGTGAAAATSLGAAGVAGAGSTSDNDFYAHEHFDDSNFYGDRSAGRASGGSTSGATGGSMRGDSEVQLPTTRDGAIVRRGGSSTGSTGGSSMGSSTGSSMDASTGSSADLSGDGSR